jgi:hypothetical protein
MVRGQHVKALLAYTSAPMYAFSANLGPEPPQRIERGRSNPALSSSCPLQVPARGFGLVREGPHRNYSASPGAHAQPGASGHTVRALPPSGGQTVSRYLTGVNTPLKVAALGRA